MTNPSVTLRIARSHGKYQEFHVAVASPHSRLLDALLQARSQQDPTLAFRYACRVGMCGSCAVVINGREGLTCQVSIGQLATPVVTLEPLRALPVQRDLMVDMTPFFDRFSRTSAALVPSQPDSLEARVLPPGEARRAAIEQQNGCITCGSCFSCDPRVASDPAYPGLAALNRVYMLAQDERDARGHERLDGLSREVVEHAAEVTRADTICPVGIPLTTGMRRLEKLL